MQFDNHDVTVRNAVMSDASAIAKIYNFYVLTSTITFEEKAVTEKEMEKRIKDVTENFPWLVAEFDGQVVGYAYAGQFGARSAYRYSAEGSIYVDNEMRAKGIGRLLYKELIGQLKRQNVHTLIACIALPNVASMSLHKKLGFQPVAHFKEVGFKQEKWIDVTHCQLMM
jgi:L-amino acid N-acyltransferase YncA